MATGPAGHGHQAVRAGSSGFAAEPFVHHIGENDAAAQTRQVFDNIGNVLKTAGGSFDDVVELMCYIVGRDSVPGYMEARTTIFEETFPDGNYPTANLLVIEGLADERFLVEVSAVAALA